MSQTTRLTRLAYLLVALLILAFAPAGFAMAGQQMVTGAPLGSEQQWANTFGAPARVLTGGYIFDDNAKMAAMGPATNTVTIPLVGTAFARSEAGGTNTTGTVNFGGASFADRFNSAEIFAAPTLVAGNGVGGTVMDPNGFKEEAAKVAMATLVSRSFAGNAFLREQMMAGSGSKQVKGTALGFDEEAVQ